jgi:hemolysin activation/secretion protein
LHSTTRILYKILGMVLGGSVGVLALLGASHAAAAEALAQAANPAAPKPEARFDIAEFRVLGTHVLPREAIERAVYAYLGPDRTIDTVKQAADALEKAYKQAGYGAVYVDIPEQEVAGGIVRLQVTEGRLESVHVRGERYYSRRQILAGLPALETGTSPSLPALQKELGALNARTSDRVVTPVLKAGSDPGTVDVDLDVKDTMPLHGFVSYDNRHTADTTPNRATAALSYDNLWQRQDTVGLMYQSAPAKPSDAKVLIANYLAHVGATDSEAAFTYTRTYSNVLALGTLGVLGKGTIYGGHWIKPLESTPTDSQTFNLGADYKDVLTSVQPNTPTTTSTGSTSAAPVTALVKYVNWSALYTGTWSRGGFLYSASGSANFGIRGAVNSSNEFENARYNAYPNYFYLHAGFGATQPLPGGLAFQERLNAQWSDSPLVNNEQFSLGGVDTVRGYLEAETLGDSGATGTLELHSPSVGPHLGSFLSPLYAFVFVDAGVATLVDALPSQRENITLWGKGVGLRLENIQGVTGSLDYAVPERDGLRTLRGDHRIDFSLRYGF